MVALAWGKPRLALAQAHVAPSGAHGPPACRHSGCRSTLRPLACTTVPCCVSELRQPSSEKVMPDSSTT